MYIPLIFVGEQSQVAALATNLTHGELLNVLSLSNAVSEDRHFITSKGKNGNKN